MKHYVYRIDEPITGEFYFGSRTCECNIEDDIMYMGSYVTWKPEDSSLLVKTILKSNFRKRETAIKYEAVVIKENIDNSLNRNYHIPNKGFYNKGHTGTTKIKISKAAKIRLKDKTMHPMYGKHHTDESKEKNKISNINNDLSGVNSATWKLYIPKLVLDDAIQRELTSRQIWSECNSGQKHLTKSLLYHYATTDMYLIRWISHVKKDELIRDIPLITSRNLYKKYNMGQRQFNKLLIFYFNTHKLTVIKNTLK